MKNDRKVHDIIDTALCSEGGMQRTRFSIEIYPPRSVKGHQKLLEMLRCYCTLGVTHINVTGKVNKNHATLDLVRFIKEALPHVVVVPHIVGYNLSVVECRNIVRQYEEMGVSNVFLVRGDIEDEVRVADCGSTMDFPHACDLVQEIKRTNPHLCVGVAGYPAGHYEQPNFLQDMQNLKRKVEAGADYIITQLFFENREFVDFVKRCGVLGIDVPIIPGLTYVKSKQHIQKISSLALGSVIPAKLLQRMYDAQNAEESYNVGEAWLNQQVEEFVRAAEPLVHFYVFNVMRPFAALIERHAAL